MTKNETQVYYIGGTDFSHDAEDSEASYSLKEAKEEALEYSFCGAYAWIWTMENGIIAIYHDGVLTHQSPVAVDDPDVKVL